MKVTSALVALALGWSSIGAAAVLHPQRQLRATTPPAALVWHPFRMGPHVLHGTIVALRGPLLTLRLRSGRSQPVDASIAIARDDYSAPLFVGKLVSVDGDVRGGIFAAAHVFRLTSLIDLKPDR